MRIGLGFAPLSTRDIDLIINPVHLKRHSHFIYHPLDDILDPNFIWNRSGSDAVPLGRPASHDFSANIPRVTSVALVLP
ncbi:MAG TPA: hypothetical protein DEP53_03325 [Bacteroidetes bacterium]|nr:hypothetical protein [Bacteroidota bacterium]